MDNENVNTPKNDLERIENRMRTNFFEIEKRLAELESTSTHSAMEEIKERIQELEDLQMLTQAQILQLKQQITGEIGEFSSGDIAKRLERIEDIVSKGVPVAVSHDIEKRIENLERVKDYSSIKKMLDGFQERISSISEAQKGDFGPVLKRLEEVDRKLLEVLPKTEILSRKVETLEKLSGKDLDMQPLLNRIEDVEKLAREKQNLGQIEKRIGEIEKDVKDSRKNYDEKIEALSTKLETIKSMGSQSYEPILRKIELIERVMKDSQIAYNKRFSEIECLIESSGKLMTEPGMKVFMDRILEARNDITKKIEDFEVAKERLDRLIRERQDMLMKIENTEINISKADALLAKIRTESAKLENMAEKISSMEEKINQIISSKIGDLEAIRSELYERSVKMNEKINAEIEKSSAIRNEIAMRSEELSRKINEIEKMGTTASQLFEKASGDFTRRAENALNSIVSKAQQEDMERKLRMAEMEKYLNALRERMEKTDIDSRFATLSKDLNSRMEQVESVIYDKAVNKIQEAANETLMKFGTMAVDIEKRIDSKIADIEKMASDTERSFKVALETENRINAKMNNTLREINLRFDNIEGRFEKLRMSNEEAIEKQWEEIKNVSSGVKSLETKIRQSLMSEEKVHEQSVKILNDYLKRFSSSLDARLAGIPTRKEINEISSNIKRSISKQIYDDVMEEIAKGVSTGRAQNMEIIIRKISMLEQQLAEIRQFIRGVSVKVPTIVE